MSSINTKNNGDSIKIMCLFFDLIDFSISKYIYIFLTNCHDPCLIQRLYVGHSFLFLVISNIKDLVPFNILGRKTNKILSPTEIPIRCARHIDCNPYQK